MNPERGNLNLDLNYGCDKDGVSTSLTVYLKRSDLAAVTTYLMLHAELSIGMLQFDWADGGDGDELPLPRVSATELDAMQAATVLPC
jgi:hypothetical protein